jgi:hypothetical protein
MSFMYLVQVLMANAAVLDALSCIREDLALVKDQLSTTQAAHTGILQLVTAKLSKAMPESNALDTQEHRHQRARVAQQHRCALDKNEILDEVFSYVGIGEYIYAAGVCRKWRGRYIKLCYNKAPAAGTEKLRTCYKRTITTADRFQLALDSGLTVAELQDAPVWSRLALQIINDSLEPTAVFTIAKLHDFEWGTYMCTQAAMANNLELLQWLHKSGCPWNLQHVRNFAIQLGHIAILGWLYAVTQPWSQSMLDELLWRAGLCKNLEVAKWLRKIGAAWPNSFHHVDEDDSQGFWDSAVVKWALANGCTWGRWRCEDMLPVHWSCWTCEREQERCFHDHCDSKQACDLLRWAHENGCPCTCDAETAAAVKAALLARQQQQQQQQQLALKS